MAAVATLSFVEAQKVLDTWAVTGGPTEQEQIQYANAALKELDNEDQVKKFQDNVKQVGVWANQLDTAFDHVTRGFEDMVAKYGKDFPDISAYLNEWKGYKGNWVQYLLDSRDVASKNITLLKRFDQIFLDMVENIQTDQDRLDVMKELEQFIDEKHDDSVQLSQNFLNLKRDIEAFVDKFDQWIVEKGVELEVEAKQLKQQIAGLQGEVETLDKKIKDATTALAITGGCLCIIGVVVAGSVLAVYQSQRNSKVEELQVKRNALEDVNRKQQNLAHLKTEFDGFKPDISLICEKLVLFAEIWSSVRSQAVQFQEHIKGGMVALTSLRFKREVQLARAVSKPLMEGLAKYATELDSRGKANK
ncbi:uncharacterized protein FIBRA_04124 [Fibroporia radiculosa]|uniref:Uncharacterized protein n=1 Tax=Fibroporia radiculosa TaxID=599839 RepID=J4G6V6_9APHY|nr:uncharacterized protein FIBRA_04124 [Fibroporia radiculosa]CCM02048.1 predicted protein [Fibroporia radiculosa]